MVDYILELFMTAGVMLIMIVTILLYVGLCIYIKGTVEDLKSEMNEINNYLMHAKRSRTEQINIELGLTEQIGFHHEIIR